MRFESFECVFNFLFLVCRSLLTLARHTEEDKDKDKDKEEEEDKEGKEGKEDTQRGRTERKNRECLLPLPPLYRHRPRSWNSSRTYRRRK